MRLFHVTTVLALLVGCVVGGAPAVLAAAAVTPAAPTNLTATSSPGSTSITLAWTNPVSNFSYVEIKRSQDGGPLTIVVPTAAASTVSSYTDSFLADATYSYSVYAWNANGSPTAVSSAAISSNVTINSMPPNAPSLAAQGTSGSRTVNLIWNLPSSNGWPITEFRLESQLDSGTWTSLATTSAVTTSYSATNLADGSYNFRITAVNAAGTSAYGTDGPVTVMATPPAAPTNLTTASGSGTSSILVSWTNPVSNFSSATVERSLNSAAWTTLSSGSPISSYQDSGLADGSYVYRVTSVNSVGLTASASTSAVTITTPPAPAPDPAPSNATPTPIPTAGPESSAATSTATINPNVRLVVPGTSVQAPPLQTSSASTRPAPGTSSALIGGSDAKCATRATSTGLGVACGSVMNVPTSSMLTCRNHTVREGLRLPGLYVQVLDGMVNLTNNGGSQNFSAGQFGYVASTFRPPVVVPANPGIQFAPPPTSTTQSGLGTQSDTSGSADCVIRSATQGKATTIARTSMVRGSVMLIEAGGLAPGTGVSVWFASRPQEPAGLFAVNPQGTLSSWVRVPAGLPIGAQTVQIAGTTREKLSVAVNLGVAVRAAKPVLMQQSVDFAPLEARLSKSAATSLGSVVGQLSPAFPARCQVNGFVPVDAGVGARALAHRRAMNVTANLAKHQIGCSIAAPITVRSAEPTARVQVTIHTGR